jgi:hypothetical protein
LGGVGRVARALVFVKRDEHMNGISGFRLEIGRLDVIIRPQLIQNLLFYIAAFALPLTDSTVRDGSFKAKNLNNWYLNRINPPRSPWRKNN